MKKFNKNNLNEQDKDLRSQPAKPIEQNKQTYSQPVNNTPNSPGKTTLPAGIGVMDNPMASSPVSGSIYSTNWKPNTGCSIDVTAPPFNPCTGTMAQQFTMINGATTPSTCDYIGVVDLTAYPNWMNDTSTPPWIPTGLCDTDKDACVVFDSDSCKFFVSDNNGTWANPCESSGCDWGTSGVGNDSLSFAGKYCDTNSQCEDQYDGNAFPDCLSANCGGITNAPGCADPLSVDYLITNTGCLGSPANTSCCNYTSGCMDNRQDSTGAYISNSTGWGIPGAVGPMSIVSDCGQQVQLSNIIPAVSPWGFAISNMNFTSGGSFSCCGYDTPNTDMNGCMDPGPLGGPVPPNYNSSYEFDCNTISSTGLPPMQSGDPGFVGTYGNTSCCGIIYGCTIANAQFYNPSATNPCDNTNGTGCINGQTGPNCCCDLSNITGCMDPLGSTYSSSNTFDCGGNLPPVNTVGNTSCCGGYQQGCMDATAINSTFTPGAVADCSGSLVITYNDALADPTLIGTPYNTWPSYTTVTTSPTTIAFTNADVTCCTFAINGCTDPLATNECSNGCNTDDGSCLYESCPNSGADNYMFIPFPGGPQYIPAPFMYSVSGGVGCIPDAGGAMVVGNEDCCNFPIAGCLDDTAFNYNNSATQDCESVAGWPSGPPCLVDAGGALQTGPNCCCCYVAGCMDATATNYDPNACSDDGSCVWQGCTHNLAWNYDSAATQDDGSCIYMGCTDTTAFNFNNPGCFDVNGTQVPCGGCPDIDPLDPAAVIDPANTGCCLFSVGCTDPDANNQNINATIPCNVPTGNISGNYWGPTGYPTGAGVIIVPTQPADDNYCCSYTSGCMDENSTTFNSAAAISNPSLCVYTWGCKEQYVPGSSGMITHTNYSAAAQYPCNDESPQAVEQLTPTTAGTILLPLTNILGTTNPSYVNTTDNDCCRYEGCTDAGTGATAGDGGTNYDPFATNDNGSCAYVSYTCSDPIGGPLGDWQNYQAGGAGCATGTQHWTGAYDANGTWDASWEGPETADVSDTTCCIPAIPNTTTWACINPGNNMGADANTPPPGAPHNGEWGTCINITSQPAVVLDLLLLDVDANAEYGIDPIANGVSAGIDYAGTYVFQGTDSFLTQSACNSSPCGDCEIVPVNGCSFCEQGGQLSDPCIQEANLYAAIGYVFSSMDYLSFNSKGECDTDEDCGIERYGCRNPNFCEYWTQVGHIYDSNGTLYEGNGATPPPAPMTGDWFTMPYAIGQNASNSQPNVWQLGGLGPITDSDGCINEIIPGCDDAGALNTDINATTTCPNPYVSSQINRDKWSGLTNIPLADIQWDSGSSIQPDFSDPNWDCLYSCEDIVYNGSPQPGDPEGVILDGGSCWYCTSQGPVQSTSPCVEVVGPSLNDYNNVMSGNPNQLWYNDDGNCCVESFCCGSGGACMDDGSNNFGGEFDAARAAAGWPVAGSTQVGACNYDPSAIGVADWEDCDYTCKGCIDEMAFNTGNMCDPNLPSQYPGVSCLDVGTSAYPLMVDEPCCCCYVEGCMDASALNYDPSACFENNGTCIYTAGYDCVIPVGQTLGMCEPHISVSGSLGQFPGQTGYSDCVDSNCGDGRWRCNVQGSGSVQVDDNYAMQVMTKTPTNITRDNDKVKVDAEKLGEQLVVNANTSGGVLAPVDDIKTPQLDKEFDLSTLGPISCCVEDPVGPWESEQECYDNSICIDCNHPAFFRCVNDPNQERDVDGNYSGKMCELQVALSPGWQYCLTYPNASDCFSTMAECEGCSFLFETWECEGDGTGGGPGKVQDDQMIREQGGSATQFCTQGGYDGWRTQDECYQETDCWKTGDDNTWCFVGKTSIKMGDGTEKRIDEVEVGEKVLNDKGTNSVVVQVEKHENVADIYGFNGEESFVTKDHPLLVKTNDEHEWKSIDPLWISPHYHGVDALELEVGDILLKGESKEEMEITSIDKGGVADVTYNLMLDTVHTYYANDYVAHNAFFREERWLKEERVGGPGYGSIDPILWPTDGCPCPVGAAAMYGPFHPACCGKGGTNPPSGGAAGCEYFENKGYGDDWRKCSAGFRHGKSSSQSECHICDPNNGPTNTMSPNNMVGNARGKAPNGDCCIRKAFNDYSSMASGGCHATDWTTGNYGTSNQCMSQVCASTWSTNMPCNGYAAQGCGNPSCAGNSIGGPPVAPPQPGGGGGDDPKGGDGSGDGKVETRKAQPKPEHSEKMSQWTKAVADNSGQRVKFDGYGADTNPLFLSDSEKEYTYEIISGDIFRIEGDNRTKIGNFVDKEDKTVDVKPTEKPIREPLPTEKPTKPVAPVETPETKELKEQVLRMKKLMGL
tara:strand:+ start:194 stop:7147 length:6954 start_codon:yes stop_codon:yes gene_type:complete